MSLVDGKVIEGVIPNDMRLVCDHGLTFTPPDSKGNTQQVFVPKKVTDELSGTWSDW